MAATITKYKYRQNNRVRKEPQLQILPYRWQLRHDINEQNSALSKNQDVEYDTDINDNTMYFWQWQSIESSLHYEQTFNEQRHFIPDKQSYFDGNVYVRRRTRFEGTVINVWNTKGYGYVTPNYPQKQNKEQPQYGIYFHFEQAFPVLYAAKKRIEIERGWKVSYEIKKFERIENNHKFKKAGYRAINLEILSQDWSNSDDDPSIYCQSHVPSTTTSASTTWNGSEFSYMSTTPSIRQPPKHEKHEMKGPLPSGWSKHYTEYGVPYYQNTKTKTTYWDIPKSAYNEDIAFDDGDNDEVKNDMKPPPNDKNNIDDENINRILQGQHQIYLQMTGNNIDSEKEMKYYPQQQHVYPSPGNNQRYKGKVVEIIPHEFMGYILDGKFGKISFKFSECRGFDAFDLREGVNVEYTVQHNKTAISICLVLLPYEWQSYDAQSKQWTSESMETSEYLEANYNPQHLRIEREIQVNSGSNRRKRRLDEFRGKINNIDISQKIGYVLMNKIGLIFSFSDCKCNGDQLSIGDEILYRLTKIAANNVVYWKVINIEKVSMKKEIIIWKWRRNEDAPYQEYNDENISQKLEKLNVGSSIQIGATREITKISENECYDVDLAEDSFFHVKRFKDDIKTSPATPIASNEDDVKMPSHQHPNKVSDKGHDIQPPPAWIEQYADIAKAHYASPTGPSHVNPPQNKAERAISIPDIQQPQQPEIPNIVNKRERIDPPVLGDKFGGTQSDDQFNEFHSNARQIYTNKIKAAPKTENKPMNLFLVPILKKFNHEIGSKIGAKDYGFHNELQVNNGKVPRRETGKYFGVDCPIPDKEEKNEVIDKSDTAILYEIMAVKQYQENREFRFLYKKYPKSCIFILHETTIAEGYGSSKKAQRAECATNALRRLETDYQYKQEFGVLIHRKRLGIKGNVNKETPPIGYEYPPSNVSMSRYRMNEPLQSIRVEQKCDGNQGRSEIQIFNDRGIYRNDGSDNPSVEQMYVDQWNIFKGRRNIPVPNHEYLDDRGRLIKPFNNESEEQIWKTIWRFYGHYKHRNVPQLLPPLQQEQNMNLSKTPPILQTPKEDKHETNSPQSKAKPAVSTPDIQHKPETRKKMGVITQDNSQPSDEGMASPTFKTIDKSERDILPKGWTKHCTAEGKVYYEDHVNQTWHWSLPKDFINKSASDTVRNLAATRDVTDGQTLGAKYTKIDDEMISDILHQTQSMLPTKSTITGDVTDGQELKVAVIDKSKAIKSQQQMMPKSALGDVDKMDNIVKEQRKSKGKQYGKSQTHKNVHSSTKSLSQHNVFTDKQNNDVHQKKDEDQKEIARAKLNPSALNDDSPEADKDDTAHSYPANVFLADKNKNDDEDMIISAVKEIEVEAKSEEFDAGNDDILEAKMHDNTSNVDYIIIDESIAEIKVGHNKLEMDAIDEVEEILNKGMEKWILAYYQFMELKQLLSGNTDGIIRCNGPESNDNDNKKGGFSSNNSNESNSNKNNKSNKKDENNENKDDEDEEQKDSHQSKHHVFHQTCNHLNECRECSTILNRKFQGMLHNLQKQQEYQSSFVESMHEIIQNMDKPKPKQKKKKSKSKCNSPNRASYEPHNLFRARNNIKISKQLTIDIMKDKVTENMNADEVYHYVDKNIAMHHSNKQHMVPNDDQKDEDMVIPLDLYHKNTNEPLYGVIRRNDPEKNEIYKFKMLDQLFTSSDPYLSGIILPESPRHKFKIQHTAHQITKFLKSPQNIAKIMKRKFNKIPIFSTEKHEERMVLYIKPETFRTKLKNHMLRYDKVIIPIVMFRNKSFWIEYILRWDSYEFGSIGVSLNFDKAGNVNISSLHLDWKAIRLQHQLVDAGHLKECRCFDAITPVIHNIHVGNPDDVINQMKSYKQRHDVIKEVLKRVKDHACEYIDSLQSEQKESGRCESPSFSASNRSINSLSDSRSSNDSPDALSNDESIN